MREHKREQESNDRTLKREGLNLIPVEKCTHTIFIQEFKGSFQEQSISGRPNSVSAEIDTFGEISVSAKTVLSVHRKWTEISKEILSKNLFFAKTKDRITRNWNRFLRENAAKILFLRETVPHVDFDYHLAKG